MRFSCKVCQATFQTVSGAAASAAFRCPSCGGEMAAVAEVVELWQDRMPTRRYDAEDLRARLDAEREEAARARGVPRGSDQIWFAAVQGRQVGPLSVAGIAGLRTRGQLSAASLVWREGLPSWVAAEAVPELRPVLGLPEEKPGQPFPVAPQEPAPEPKPPAIPRAENTELEQAASAVYAQAHSTERKSAAGPTVPIFTPAHHLVDKLSQSSSPGRYRLAADAAAGSPATFVRTPAAPAPRPAPAAPAVPQAPAAPEAPAAQEAPMRMIELSDTSSSGSPGELQPPRPRAQQEWFAQPDDRAEADSHSRWLLVGALVLAVIVVSLLLRTH